jgi:hypothetical protein
MSRAKRGWRLPKEGVSEASRKAAAGILSVLSGLRTPAEVSQALACSVNRYYQLEQRGLEGMLRALEPRTRGPRQRPEVEAQRLQREVVRWQREASRYQALLRTSQRALGMTAPLTARAASGKGPGKGPGKGKVRRPRVRAKAVIEALERIEAPVGSVAVEGGAT